MAYICDTEVLITYWKGAFLHFPFENLQINRGFVVVSSRVF